MYLYDPWFYHIFGWKSQVTGGKKRSTQGGEKRKGKIYSRVS